MQTLWQDIRYGLRGLRKRPAFTIVALVILALGIGANTAIFTLINAVLLKQLPVSKPENWCSSMIRRAKEPALHGDERRPVSGIVTLGSYRYFREHNDSFSDLSAFRSGLSALSVRQTAPGWTGRAGLEPFGFGKLFCGTESMRCRDVCSPMRDDSAAAQPSAVISHDYWKQKLNADTAVVGKTLLLNGTAFTIVGVMPPSFFGTRVRKAPDFWIPLAFHEQIELRKSFLEEKNTYWLNMVGRLKPGVSMAQANGSINNQLRQFLSDQAGGKQTEEIKKSIQTSYVQLTSGARGLSGLRTFYAGALRMLMVIVALVWLIACANVGNLLLSRAATRQAEISLRQALGASRLRLMRQLLTESLLLAVVGASSRVVAQWGVGLLVSRVAATSPLDVTPDLWVLLFSVGVSLASGILLVSLRQSAPRGSISRPRSKRNQRAAHWAL